MFAFDITPQLIPYKLVSAVAISSYTLSVVTTILSTMIIVIQILMVSRMPGVIHQSRIAIEIVVESAALYSISALIFTPMIADVSLNTPVMTYYLYADVFFGYMAVSLIPYLSIPFC